MKDQSTMIVVAAPAYTSATHFHYHSTSLYTIINNQNFDKCSIRKIPLFTKERVIKIPQFHPFRHTQGERNTCFVLKQFISPKSLFHELILCMTSVKDQIEHKSCLIQKVNLHRTCEPDSCQILHHQTKIKKVVL